MTKAGGIGEAKRTLLQNIASSLWGNSLYNLAQWLLVVVIAKLGSPEQVGNYALALAISAPIFLGIGLNLRVVQSTDAVRRWTPHEYMRLRMILNVAALSVTTIVGAVMQYDRWFFVTLVVMALAKTAEGASQVSYGYFQRRGRMDLVASSMGYRALLGLALFGVAFAVSRTVWIAILGLLIAWTIVGVSDRRQVRRLVLTDLPGMQERKTTWHRLIQLVRLGLPVGVDAAVSSLALNIPRYGVAAMLGQAALGLYAPIAYLGQLMALVGGAVGSAVLPRMSDHHRSGDRRQFLTLIVYMTILSVAISVVGVVAAYFLGEWTVKLLFGAEYVNQDLLIAIMVAFSLVTLQRSLGRALNATRSYWTYLGVDVVTTLSVTGSSVLLIRLLDLPGAAWSIAVGFAVGAVLSVCAIWLSMQRVHLGRGSTRIGP